MPAMLPYAHNPIALWTQPNGCAREHDNEDATGYQSLGVLVAFVLAYHKLWLKSIGDLLAW